MATQKNPTTFDKLMTLIGCLLAVLFGALTIAGGVAAWYYWKLPDGGLLGLAVIGGLSMGSGLFVLMAQANPTAFSEADEAPAAKCQCKCNKVA